jgi:hypothetical protein
MSSLKTPLVERIDYIETKTSGTFGGYGWTARERGKIFYLPDAARTGWESLRIMGDPYKVLKLVLLTDYQTDATGQLELLVSASARGDELGLDTASFIAHVDALVDNLQPMFVVHGFEPTAVGFEFSISPVFNLHKLAETVAWFEKKGQDYWKTLREGLVIYSKHGFSQQNIWGLAAADLLPPKASMALSEGYPAKIVHSWSESLARGHIVELSVQNFYLPEQIKEPVSNT